MHSKESTFITTVYIPPMFRVRIGLFVLAVWVFAAATGVAFTVVPLLFGRKLVSGTVPDHDNVNDIYAFSLGIYILGGAIYLGVHYNTIFNFLRKAVTPSSAAIIDTVTAAISRTGRALSLVYVYSALAIGLPFLFATLLELYVLIPIHMYFDPDGSHNVHLVQDWTLGILYVRIATQVITHTESRATRALRAVLRDGYLKPSAALATRYFVLPVMIGFAVMALAPWLGAAAINATVAASASEAAHVKIVRLSYPLTLGVISSVWFLRALRRATGRWRMRIRDEVYLIGERLHNFGERAPVPTPAAEHIPSIVS